MHLNVVLLDALAFQNWAEIHQGDDRKGDDGRNDAQDVFVFLKKSILHCVDIFLFNLFKISIFTYIWVNMGIGWLFCGVLIVVCKFLLHLPGGFLDFMLE